MNRITVTTLALIESFVTAAVGVLVCLTIFVMVWGFQYHLSAGFGEIWRSALCTWFAGHGVDVRIALDSHSAASLGLPEIATKPFTITMAVCGLSLVTLLLGARTGRRVALTPFRWEGLIGAVVVFTAVSTGLAFSAQSPVAAPVLWQAILMPPLVLAAGLIFGFIFARLRSIPASRADRVPGIAVENPRKPVLTARVRTLLLEALRGATGVTAIIVGAAAGLVAILLFTRYATVIQLYEELHTGVIGGVALTLGQLAFLPNVVIWAASWLIGPGFAVGTDSLVSPLGTYLGPVPALPLLGAIPVHGSPFALIGVVVPLLAGFVVGVLIRQRSGWGDMGVTWLCLCALGIGLVSGLEIALLAWWSAGSLGPGRLANIGPDPLLVGAISAGEVAVSALIGILVGRRVSN